MRPDNERSMFSSYPERRGFYGQRISPLVQAPPAEEGIDFAPITPGDLSFEQLLARLEKENGIQTGSGSSYYSIKPRVGESRPRLYALSPEQKNRLDRYQIYRGRDKQSARMKKNKVRIATPQGVKYIPGEYYSRESPYEEILAQGGDLFFIVRGFPMLEEKGNVSGKKRVYKTESELFLMIEKEKGFKVFYLPEHPHSEEMNIGAAKDSVLFEMGRLYWEEDNKDQALQKWNEVHPSFSNPIYQRIRSIRAEFQDKERIIYHIDSTLNYRSSLGSERLLNRLVKHNRWEKRASCFRRTN